MDNDPRYKGRVALGHVVLGLPPLVRILGGGRSEQSVALPKSRRTGRVHGKIGRVHVAHRASDVATAPAPFRGRRLALVGVLLNALLHATGAPGDAIEGRRQRAHIEAKQRELGAGGRRLGRGREGVRVDDGGLGGVRRRGCKVQIFLQDVEA